MTKAQLKKWCPNCKAIRECRSVSPTEMYPLDRAQHDRRWYAVGAPDMGWYRRIRICSTCYTDFVTVEIEEESVNELLALRATVAEIKQGVAAFENAAPGSSEKREFAKALIERLKTLK